MLKYIFACTILLMNSIMSTAQDNDSLKVEGYIEDINELSHILLRDTAKLNRIQACMAIQSKLAEALALDKNFKNNFSALEGISIITPEDKQFRVFTWQLYIDKKTYVYGGILQKADGSIFEFEDHSDEMMRPEYSNLKPKNWYGALYYNVKAFEHEGQTMYALFGFDAFEFFRRRKVMDILYFDSKGRPRFGKSVIEVQNAFKKTLKLKRYYIEYSVAVSAQLNWSEQQQMVIFDHLIDGAPIPEGGPTGVPDGSYCGLELKKGLWTYVDKVFKDDPNNVLIKARSTEEMMEDQPEKKKNRRNIFGRKR